LGQRELKFYGVLAQVGGGANEPFISEIGTLLPIALCGDVTRGFRIQRGSKRLLGIML